MKRSFLLSLLVILSMAGTAQRSISLRNDIAPARVHYHTNEEAITNFRDMYSYDENEYYLTTITTEFMDLGSWLPYSLTTYEYDYNLMPVEILTQKWDNEYVNDKKTTITYNGDDFDPLIEEELFQKWENGSWVNIKKHVYTYEPDQTILVREWNGSNFNNQYLYTIETQGSVTTILLQYWNGGAWMNQEKQVITYNSNHEVEEEVVMQWDNPNWINHERHVYNYEGEFKLTKIIKTYWDNGAWSSDKIKTINYEHENYNSIHALCEANFGGGDELNDDITMYYNEGQSVTYKHVHEVSVDYIDVTKIAEHAVSSHFTVAPNPVQDLIRIKGNRFQKAELYTLTGQKVLESLTPVINIQGLSTGAYLLKIQDQTGSTETQKVLVK